MGDGAAEGALGLGPLDVDVDPLVVAGGLGEQVDLLLRDLDVVAVAEVLAHELAEALVPCTMVVMPAMMPQAAEPHPTDVCARRPGGGGGRPAAARSPGCGPSRCARSAGVPLVDHAARPGRAPSTGAPWRSTSTTAASRWRTTCRRGGSTSRSRRPRRSAPPGRVGHLRAVARRPRRCSSSTPTPGRPATWRPVVAGWDGERVRLLVAGDRTALRRDQPGRRRRSCRGRRWRGWRRSRPGCTRRRGGRCTRPAGSRWSRWDGAVPRLRHARPATWPPTWPPRGGASVVGAGATGRGRRSSGRWSGRAPGSAPGERAGRRHPGRRRRHRARALTPGPLAAPARPGPRAGRRRRRCRCRGCGARWR